MSQDHYINVTRNELAGYVLALASTVVEAGRPEVDSPEKFLGRIAWHIDRLVSEGKVSPR